jgi:hypothetical protein
VRKITQRERDDVRRLCEDELAKPENQDFPDFAVITLHATGVLALLDEFEQALTEIIQLKIAYNEERRARIRNGYHGA